MLQRNSRKTSRFFRKRFREKSLGDDFQVYFSGKTPKIIKGSRPELIGTTLQFSMTMKRPSKVKLTSRLPELRQLVSDASPEGKQD